jgi:hypothetical protein
MRDKVGISEVINEGGLDVYFRDMAAAETGECCTAGYIVKEGEFQRSVQHPSDISDNINQDILLQE